jgi:aspartyl/asparaginyl-tRNA synthetase
LDYCHLCGDRIDYVEREMKLPEPVYIDQYPYGLKPYYTEAQMRQRWNDALDAAAKVIKENATVVFKDCCNHTKDAVEYCLSEISVLKEELK